MLEGDLAARAARRREDIGLDEHAQLRQPDDEHAIGVIARLHAIQPDFPATALQRVRLLHGQEADRLRRARQRIGSQRPRPRERIREEGDVRGLRDDGGALGREGSQTGGMIEVRVRVDHVADGLAGDQPARFGDDLARARFALRAFDHGHVIAEIDGERGVATRHAGTRLRPAAPRAGAPAPSSLPAAASRQRPPRSSRSRGRCGSRGRARDGCPRSARCARAG